MVIDGDVGRVGPSGCGAGRRVGMGRAVDTRLGMAGATAGGENSDKGAFSIARAANGLGVAMIGTVTRGGGIGLTPAAVLHES